MYLDIDQNSDEWFACRVGKVTGSRIGKIMANYGKAFGEPAKDLAATIACELIVGDSVESNDYSNAHMERGTLQEPLARAEYEEKYFVDVTNGGFFDNGNTGCSPDGLILDDGVIEIKSVLRHIQVKNVKRAKVDPAYKWQCYFNLKETGREWIDFVSYCADFPEDNRLFVFRTNLADISEELKMMEIRLEEFFNLVEETKPIITGKYK